jgi:hypothetical protein
MKTNRKGAKPTTHEAPHGVNSAPIFFYSRFHHGLLFLGFFLLLFCTGVLCAAHGVYCWGNLTAIALERNAVTTKLRTASKRVSRLCRPWPVLALRPRARACCGESSRRRPSISICHFHIYFQLLSCFLPTSSLSCIVIIVARVLTCVPHHQSNKHRYICSEKLPISMPELPEVENFRKLLLPLVSKKSLLSIESTSDNPPRTFLSTEDIALINKNCHVSNVLRKGKQLCMVLECKKVIRGQKRLFLFLHMGMTG